MTEVNIDFNMLDRLVTLLGIAVGIIGVLIAIRARRDQWRIAAESGVLNKPVVGVAIFGCRLGSGYPDNENWFFVHPGGKADYATFPIRFLFYNEGDASLDDVLITIQVSNRIFWKSLRQTANFLTFPSLMEDNIKESVDEIGDFTIVSFAIPGLSPKSGLELVLPLAFTSSLMEMSVPVRVGKSTITPHVRLLYSNLISISIFSAHIAPQIYELHIGAISARNIADAVRRYNASREGPEKISQWTALRRLFEYETEVKVTNFVAFDVESQARDSKRKLYIMKTLEKLTRSGWINSSQHDPGELENVPTGCILGVVELERVPKTQRRMRFSEGNLVIDERSQRRPRSRTDHPI